MLLLTSQLAAWSVREQCWCRQAGHFARETEYHDSHVLRACSYKSDGYTKTDYTILEKNITTKNSDKTQTRKANIHCN